MGHCGAWQVQGPFAIFHVRELLVYGFDGCAGFREQVPFEEATRPSVHQRRTSATQRSLTAHAYQVYLLRIPRIAIHFVPPRHLFLVLKYAESCHVACGHPRRVGPKQTGKEARQLTTRRPRESVGGMGGRERHSCRCPPAMLFPYTSATYSCYAEANCRCHGPFLTATNAHRCL